MRLRRTVLLSLCASLTFLSCGTKPKTFDVKRPVTQEPTSVRQQAVNVTAAATKALQTRRDEQVIFLVAGSHAKEQPDIPQEPSSVTIPSSPTVVTVPATSSYNWDALAVCETGADWTAHGSRYSSALGIMNQAVRENATEEVAARILSGTASREEQIQVAESIAARHGIRSWACWEAAVG